MEKFIKGTLIAAVLLHVAVCDGEEGAPALRIPSPIDCSLVLCAFPDCLNPVTPKGQCCPVCPEPTGPPDCSAVLCLRPDCPNPVVPEGECCGVCPEEPTEQSCPIEGQVFTECGTACPPTCAEPGPKFCTLQCVVGCQCPAGTVLDEVANRCVPVEKCSPVICPLRPCILPVDCKLIIPPDPNDPCACPTCGLDCSTVLCAAPFCPNPVTPKGQCCPVCPEPIDCSLVRCALPNCPNPVIPEGECCPVCPEPIDCSLVRCALPNCPNPVTPEGQCCPVCPKPDCSAVLCLRPDCPDPVVPEGECCGVCPEEPTEQSCPIEGQVFTECGTACPPTCAEPGPTFCTEQCVIGCQCPAGTVLDEVANRCVPVEKCTCPPDCTRDFCVANPRARCNIPGPREIPGCFGQCQLTFCRACYFSEEARELPGNCGDCGSPVSDFRCLKRWARCIHRADIKENGRPDASCITQDKFKCYRYPCQLRG